MAEPTPVRESNEGCGCATKCDAQQTLVGLEHGCGGSTSVRVKAKICLAAPSDQDGEVVMTSTLTRPQLTTSDRCGRCGAAARVRAVLPSGGELLFCGHH